MATERYVRHAQAIELLRHVGDHYDNYCAGSLVPAGRELSALVERVDHLHADGT